MHRTYGVYAKGIKVILFIVSSYVVWLLGGCASSPKTYGIKGDGDPVLNRDVNGKSLSVVVRLYQLRDMQEFSKLTFDALADGRPEGELLGPALIDKTDVVVVPGGGYASTEKLHEETRYVGIVAFFRRPDQFYWRQLVEADVVRSQGLNFRVQDCYVMLNGIKAVALPGQPASGRPDCGATNSAPVKQSSRPATTGSSAQRNPQPRQPQYQQAQSYNQAQQNPQASQYGQPQQYQQAPQYPQGQQYPQYQPYPQAQSYQQGPQYPQQPYQQGAAPATGGQKSGGFLQGMPDVNITANTPIAPANVRVGRGGVSSVTVGEQPAPTYPAPQPAPAQPYYGQPYPAQPYSAQSPYDASRY